MEFRDLIRGGWDVTGALRGDVIGRFASGPGAFSAGFDAAVKTARALP